MLPQFKKSHLLETALTHRSALNEPDSGTTSKTSNERLEFLGDAVLELAVSRFLFVKYPDEPEGKLTAYRSALVRTTTLAEVALQLELGKKLYMSKGEQATGGRTNQSLLADTMEAVIGAIYIDRGFIEAEAFIAEFILPKLPKIKKEHLYKDPKSSLQEIVQAQSSPTPVYEVVAEIGPDHDKEFTVQVKVGDKVVGQGKGHSKQQAQQEAAKQALNRFDKN
ncbi:MAG: ribonuclease III [Patescibacteria group bacterium]|nr:ribonuclease III [Patescibacteria group bacterium]